MTLAVDTSQPVGAVALARDGALLGEARFDPPSSHLVELSRAVERLLSKAGLAARDVDRVAVVRGPGSFTGVRIALSFAKGLAAAGADVVAIDSLRLLALPWLDEGRDGVCAMIDAKRGEVYAAVFGRGPHAVVEEVPARSESPAAFLDSLRTPPRVFVGTGALAHRDLIAARFAGADIADETRAYPSMPYLAAMEDLPPLARDAVRALEPLYLRPSGAERVRLRSHARKHHGDA